MDALLANVKLPPLPAEITDDYDVEALEKQLRPVKILKMTRHLSDSSGSPTLTLGPQMLLAQMQALFQMYWEATANLLLGDCMTSYFNHFGLPSSPIALFACEEHFR